MAKPKKETLGRALLKTLLLKEQLAELAVEIDHLQEVGGWAIKSIKKQSSHSHSPGVMVRFKLDPAGYDKKIRLLLSTDVLWNWSKLYTSYEMVPASPTRAPAAGQHKTVLNIDLYIKDEDEVNARIKWHKAQQEKSRRYYTELASAHAAAAGPAPEPYST